MKIISLTLHNFGIYACDNTFELSSNKPVILIGGMNGRGKTTFLEAVLLALYGRRSFAFAESGLSFPKYLAGLVNKTGGTNKAGVRLCFELTAEGGMNRYTVLREWSSHSASLKTSVSKNGASDQLLSDNWDMFVEEMLPSAIAPFFFFDGEKISELALSGDDLNMKASIKALLGVNVIEQAIADIQHVINGKRKAVKSDKLTKEINELDAQLSEAKMLMKASAESAEKLEKKQNILQNKLDAAENAYSAMGGKLAASREDLKDRLSALETKLKSVNSRLLDIAAGDLPLLMTMPLLGEILKTAEDEREQRDIRAAIERLPALFMQYDKNNNLAASFDSFLSFVKSTAADNKPVYGLTENGYFQLRTLISSLPGVQKDEAHRVLDNREELLSQKEELESYLSLSVDGDAAEKKHKEILQLTAELAIVKEQRRMAAALTAANEAQHKEIARQKSKLVERAVGSLEGADDAKRTVAYAGLSIEVLQEYKTRLQAVKTKQLSRTMTDCFNRIASKQNLIHEIQIDELTLDFHYYAGDGYEVVPSSFSAGERQLLVIAMLWALGLCSKKQLPIIIDTPLARLDSVHREALITNYFPCAGEQTILLSTDSEVHSRHYELLRPFVGREYTLVYDDNTKQSSVKTGYFGEKEQ